MYNRQRAWLWLSAAVSFLVGLILIMNDISAGWVFVIMGIIYIGVSTRGGQGWAASNPRFARWGLIVLALLLVLLTILVGAGLLLK
jgi:hypothetical protein